MKRLILVLFTMVLTLTSVNPVYAAVNGTVSMLNATGTTNGITVSGTTVNIVAAVIVQVLDDENNMLKMESYTVSNNAFSDTISDLSLTAGETYTVRAADYDGGVYTTKSVLIPTYTPSTPPVPSTTESTITHLPSVSVPTSQEPTLIVEEPRENQEGQANDINAYQMASLQPESTVTVNNSTAFVETKLNVQQIDAIRVAANETESPLGINLVLHSEKLMCQIDNNMIDNIAISITLPSDFQETTGADLNGLILPSDVLDKLEKRKKDISITVNDEVGKLQYKWNFNAEDIEKDRLIDINLKLDMIPKDGEALNKIIRNAGTLTNVNKGMVIDFANNGELPAPCRVTLNVKDQNLLPGDKVFLYYYNETSNLLDNLPNNEYTVNSDLTLDVNILHNSQYILVNKLLENVTPMKEQVEGVEKITLYIGASETSGSAKPFAPATFAFVTKKGQNTCDAKEELLVNYTSSNKRVVLVNKYGIVTPVNVGKANITTNVTFADGTKKEFITTVTVEKANAHIMTKENYETANEKNRDTVIRLTLGEKTELVSVVSGYDSNDIVWMTSRKNVAVVGKNKGKTHAIVKAKSIGTDTLYLISGTDKIAKVTIIVTK